MSSMIDILRFGRQLFQTPGTVGAVAPSGKRLCQTMADAARPLHTLQGQILEFGPGLGGVTQALLDSGVPEDKLTLIEYSHDFITRLKQRFPRLNIIQGNALDFANYLEDRPLAGIVSSLPLKLFSKTDCHVLMAKAGQTMVPGGRFVQFSYGLKSPLPYDTIENMGFKVTPWIWRNLPPARVWVYKKTL